MMGINHVTSSNIVDESALRGVQKETLNTLSKVLAKTYGPMGSNTIILKGHDKASLVAEYSKDGNKVLKAVSFSDPIEMSIQSQIVDITNYTDKKVGDGTTSATLLSTAVFNRLCDYVDDNNTKITPYKLIEEFKKAVALIQEEIIKSKKTVESTSDIYDLCMISTNGNDKISKTIAEDIYSKYGNNVFVDTNVSTTEEDVIKAYNGLTLDEGYSDTAYINNTKGQSVIENPDIFAFEDPIDTVDMAALLNAIITNNITTPIAKGEPAIPTVIVSPKISRDVAPIIEKLCTYLYSFDSTNPANKPPILIITNLLGGNMDKYYDIAKLAKCKPIRKYIDTKIEEQDIEKGLAPTPETVMSFAGKCEKVVADASMSTFTAPCDMYQTNEDGESVPTNTYAGLLRFVEDAMNNAIINGDDDFTVNKFRKRLQSLKSNYIEYLVGGISIADRESKRDLVQDAIKNCRSATNYGIGAAANVEGLIAAKKVIESSDGITKDMAIIISNAYTDIITTLYSSYTADEEEIANIITTSIEKHIPLNIRTGEYDGKVITSIRSDVEILDAISKIVTIMFTANQCLVQAPQINNY